MALTRQDVIIYQGDDYILDFNIVDSLKQNKDITTYTFEWVMVVSQSIMLHKSTVAGNISVFDTSHARVVLNSVDTAERQGVYQHELRMIDLNGNSQVVAVGKIDVLKSYTR